jgi:hypothetical protein
MIFRRSRLEGFTTDFSPLLSHGIVIGVIATHIREQYF